MRVCLSVTAYFWHVDLLFSYLLEQQESITEIRIFWNWSSGYGIRVWPPLPEVCESEHPLPSLKVEPQMFSLAHCAAHRPSLEVGGGNIAVTGLPQMALC